MLDKLYMEMDQAIAEISRGRYNAVQIYHHNDSDGLTSGAILTQAFEREGFGTHRFCLEKTYPEILNQIISQKNCLIVFADFAGRIAPLISKLNQGRNLVIILDHHKAWPVKDSMVFNLDPELYGLRGDRDVSASTTSYLFAKRLNPVNQDLSGIATVGAVGDGFFIDGHLSSINKEVALESARHGLMQITKHSGGEKYIYWPPEGPSISCKKMGNHLDTLGAVGYYQDGPQAGVEYCLNGMSPRIENIILNLNTTQDHIFTSELNILKQKGVKKTRNIQWLSVNNRFFPMGVKMIGAFINKYKNTTLFEPDKYIAGFQTVPDNIPGMGLLNSNLTKVSMRVPLGLEKKILKGNALGLDQFLPGATKAVGGFSDACHSLAAATTLPMGSEEALVGEMEKIIELSAKRQS